MKKTSSLLLYKTAFLFINIFLFVYGPAREIQVSLVKLLAILHLPFAKSVLHSV